MYKIDPKVDKPDINFMENRIKSLMNRGISVADMSLLYDRFIDEKNRLAQILLDKYGIKNPNSSKQLVDFISSVDNAEVYEACFIDGKWTTNKDALGSLRLLGFEFATELLEYRQAKKFSESIKSMMDAIEKDGRVHPTVSLSKTNRINYSSPALMNIPKVLLWNMIKPNKTGNVLVSADIKNQEPNIMINFLNIENLKEALRDQEGLYEHIFKDAFRARAKLNIIVVTDREPGVVSNSELSDMGDIPPVYYTPTGTSVSTTYYNGVQVRAIDITNVVANVNKEPILPNEVTIETIDDKQYRVEVIWDDYNKSKLSKVGLIEIGGDIQGVEVVCKGIERKEFKTAWNAMTYGAGEPGVKQMCKHIDGRTLYKYFANIPELKQYRGLCKKAADNGNQTIKTFFGTTLYANEANKSRLKRVLMDLPIQGTAADILSLLLMHCDKEIENRGLKGKLEIYYTRHDEIIFEADKNWVNNIGVENVKSIIRDMVEHQINNWEPFKVEVKIVEASKEFDIQDEDE